MKTQQRGGHLLDLLMCTGNWVFRSRSGDSSFLRWVDTNPCCGRHLGCGVPATVGANTCRECTGLAAQHLPPVPLCVTAQRHRWQDHLATVFPQQTQRFLPGLVDWALNSAKKAGIESSRPLWWTVASSELLMNGHRHAYVHCPNPKFCLQLVLSK